MDEFEAARVLRRKQIANAVALASQNSLVPAAVKVGLAAMAEELRDLDARLAAVEFTLKEEKKTNA